MRREPEFYSKISDRPRLHGKNYSNWELKPGFVYLPVGEVKASVEWVHKGVPTLLKQAIGEVRSVAKLPFSFFRKTTVHTAHGGKNAVLSIPEWAVPNWEGGHGRSVKLVSRFELDGKKVEALDIKGTGPTNLKARPKETDDRGTFDVKQAWFDAQQALAFHELGLRVALPVAIHRLHEIYSNDGKKISIAEARRQGLVSKGRTPALYLRAVESPITWRDATDEDALKFFQEHRKQYGWKNITDYAVWVARNVGKSLAVIRNNGLHYCFPHGGNVTLAGELKDFDGIIPKEKADKEFEKHYYAFGNQIGNFLLNLRSYTHLSGSRETHFAEVDRAFVEGYVYNRDKEGWFSEFRKMYDYGGVSPVVYATHCLPPDKKDYAIPANTGLPELPNIFERRGKKPQG